jgi:peptidyl-prolyl cis-trans isomerase SurA
MQASEQIKPVAPTERELRDFFEKNRNAFGERPASVSFRQIVVAPQPAPAAKQRAYQLADSIAKALRAGGDFATAARRFSGDSASRSQGGELGWQRRGQFERPFDEAVFRLRPGTISEPVETVFGYHVIQVERVQPTEVQARHILIIPETTPADRDSARALAARVADAARAGASFDSLQRVHHDGSEEREALNAPVDRLPAVYTTAIAEADSGSIAGPFELAGPEGRVKFAILRIADKRPAGEVTFADVVERLRQVLSEDLAQERYVTRLRASTYVDIRTP